MLAYATTDTRTEAQRERADAMPRVALLAFLRTAVATMARPDAVHDLSTDPARRQ